MPRAVSTNPDYPALVASLARGGRDAMERLLLDAQSLAYRFSVLVCGNGPDAEDAMQDALLQTYRGAARIREPRAFRTWLYRTVKNACLMSRRPHARAPLQLLPLDEDGTPPVAAETPGPEDLAVRSSEHRQLERAFQALPKSYRAVVFLRDIEGLSTREVADVLGISTDNVKQRLHRGRAMLKNALADGAGRSGGAGGPGAAVRAGEPGRLENADKELPAPVRARARRRVKAILR
jgi:RNA polymerase sigma-70 factor (ECF subfamily)